MSITQLSYEIVKGHPWKRDIAIKFRRNRRLAYPAFAVSYLRGPSGEVTGIPTEIRTNGVIRLELTPAETLDLVPGSYTFDVVADISDDPLTVAQGTINVLELDRITPLEGGYDMLISFRQGTDVRYNFTWKDALDAVLSVSNARLTAVDADGTPVIDISYFATPPSEVTIAALPAISRGYLSPKVGASVELHLSEKLVVAPGVYSYDVKGQDSVSGDWDVLSTGQIRVIKSYTTTPGA